MEKLRETRLHHAVQRHRPAGDDHLLRLRRGRPARGHPTDRQTVPGTDLVPRRARLRNGDGMAQATTRAGELTRMPPALGAAIRHEWTLDPDFLTVNHGSFGATPNA